MTDVKNDLHYSIIPWVNGPGFHISGKRDGSKRRVYYDRSGLPRRHFKIEGIPRGSSQNVQDDWAPYAASMADFLDKHRRLPRAHRR